MVGGWEGMKGGSGWLGGEVDCVDGWAWLLSLLGGLGGWVVVVTIVVGRITLRETSRFHFFETLRVKSTFRYINRV